MLKALCTPMTGGGACGVPVLYGDIGGEPRPRGPAAQEGTCVSNKVGLVHHPSRITFGPILIRSNRF